MRLSKWQWLHLVMEGPMLQTNKEVKNNENRDY